MSRKAGDIRDIKHDSINLLIVDDDDEVLWTLKELLEVYDFKVETATSGLDALAVLGKTDPDCILMDIVMPEQSGIDVFRAIKPLKPEVPVIFMTGYAHYNLEDEARREGAVDVIAKPIDMKYLITLIEDITTDGYFVPNQSLPYRPYGSQGHEWKENRELSYRLSFS